MNRLTATQLRRLIGSKGEQRARFHPHEATYGSIPSIVFQEFQGRHGNFHPDSYREIQANPDWARRLEKSYTASRWVARSHDRYRRELDCATSSDALLMNIFCYPGALASVPLCALLGVTPGLQPVFGHKPRTPLANGHFDRTEIDLVLGSLMIEAKLTETGFQSAPLTRVHRYRDFEETFEVSDLPIAGNSVQSYQLIRGVLAAKHLDGNFAVLCDARRLDLIEHWFHVLKAVRHCELRNRLALFTWQELSKTLPKSLQLFLDEKYDLR